MESIKFEVYFVRLWVRDIETYYAKTVILFSALLFCRFCYIFMNFFE